MTFATMKLRVVIVFAVINTGVLATDCSDGWLAFQGSCYLFSHDASSFTEAEHYCQQHGAYLAHVSSDIENKFLLSFLRDSIRNNHWIGITDRDIEGVWTFVGEDTRVTYFDWLPGEPNEGTHSNCVSIRADHNYRWIDDPCGLSFNPICEKRGQVCTDIVG